MRSLMVVVLLSTSLAWAQRPALPPPPPPLTPEQEAVFERREHEVPPPSPAFAPGYHGFLWIICH